MRRRQSPEQHDGLGDLPADTIAYATPEMLSWREGLREKNAEATAKFTTNRAITRLITTKAEVEVVPYNLDKQPSHDDDLPPAA